ncbi:hypothetical protein [Pseudomonas sp. RC10]|uniref:hypothetical protein n=1 Tax=Pseudomonas bambusae TaxID=3139142 RepID=UPI003139E909
MDVDIADDKSAAGDVFAAVVPPASPTGFVAYWSFAYTPGIAALDVDIADDTSAVGDVFAAVVPPASPTGFVAYWSFAYTPGIAALDAHIADDKSAVGAAGGTTAATAVDQAKADHAHPTANPP